jgi:hypothetical protein
MSRERIFVLGSKKAVVVLIVLMFAISSLAQTHAANSSGTGTNTQGVDNSTPEISTVHNDDGSYTITYQPINISGTNDQKTLRKVLSIGGFIEPSTYQYAPFDSNLHSGFAYDNDHFSDAIVSYFSLLSFNLTGLPYFASNVELKLYGTGSNIGIDGPGTIHNLGSSSVSVYNVKDSWIGTGDSIGINYGGLINDALSNAKIDSYTNNNCDGKTSQWYSWNITDLYNKWNSGEIENNGILLGCDGNGSNIHSFQGINDTASTGVSPNRPSLSSPTRNP